VLRRQPGVPPFQTVTELKSVIFQILEGVQFMHSRRIFHRHLSPRHINIQRSSALVGVSSVDTSIAIRISGFSLARSFLLPTLRTYTHEVVSLWYRAPEILLGMKRYSCAIDVWSVGCLLAEFATGRTLFRGDCEIGQLFEIFQLLGTPSEQNGIWWPSVADLPEYRYSFPDWAPQDLQQVFPSVDADGIDLLKALLRYDPSLRISAKDALRHRWFDDVRASASGGGGASISSPSSPHGDALPRTATEGVPEPGGTR
jgi:cyclin-dependent kinase 3